MFCPQRRHLRRGAVLPIGKFFLLTLLPLRPIFFQVGLPAPLVIKQGFIVIQDVTVHATLRQRLPLTFIGRASNMRQIRRALDTCIATGDRVTAPQNTNSRGTKQHHIHWPRQQPCRHAVTGSCTIILRVCSLLFVLRTNLWRSARFSPFRRRSLRLRHRGALETSRAALRRWLNWPTKARTAPRERLSGPRNAMGRFIFPMPSPLVTSVFSSVV